MLRTNRIGLAAVLALGLTLGAAPVLAQDWSKVEAIATEAGQEAPEAAYRAAVAACLASQGDAAKATEVFTAAGWTVTAEPEMGTLSITGALDNLYALAADDGSFCAVYAEAQGTRAASAILHQLAVDAAFEPQKTKGTMGCLAYELGPRLLAEVTSSGNDPVCDDAATSSIRFEWAPAE